MVGSLIACRRLQNKIEASGKEDQLLLLLCATEDIRSGSPQISSHSSRVTLPHMPELRDVPDSPPPFLGSWRRVYLAVLIYLVGVILAAYFFTRA